jgi:hypothetical protein
MLGLGSPSEAFRYWEQAGGKVEHVHSCVVIQADRHFPLDCGRAAEALPGLK